MRVSGRTTGLLARALETVDMARPQALATSRTVTRGGVGALNDWGLAKAGSIRLNRFYQKAWPTPAAAGERSAEAGTWSVPPRTQRAPMSSSFLSRGFLLSDRHAMP